MASKTIPLLYLLLVFLIAEKGVDATIGVNWGRENAQRLIPSMVIDVLLQNGVKEVRIYTSRQDVLQAFANSGIGLTLTVGDFSVLQNYDQCKKWVQSRMQYFNVSNIRRLYVGSSLPFVAGMKNKVLLNKSIEVLRNLQNALNDAGLGHQVKATFTHSNYEMRANISKPSDAEFRDEIKLEMEETLRFLNQNDAPFVIDMIPPLHVEHYGLDPNFAFVEKTTGVVIKDRNGAVYTNIFEFVYDSFVWALTKIGYPNMKIIVGQVGWPTDGYKRGNASTTERFFKGLLPYVASNKGTPLRPGAPIDTFVHSLTDENRLPDDFMRHWGIYRSNGKPKFKIDLTGQGRDIYPTAAKGNMRMPERWCVYNGNRTDYPSVMWQQNFACKKSDCSALRIGSSCSDLSFYQNISYAFNMYFQFHFQDEGACQFGGLSYITVQNPSTPNCLFPVEMVEGQQENYVSRRPELTAKGYYHKPNCVISLFLLSFIGVLLWN